jgi:hypothetical protein
MSRRGIPGSDTLPVRLVWNSTSGRLRMPLRIVFGLSIWVIVGVTVSDFLATVLTGPSPLFQLRTSYMGNITINAVDLVVGSVSTPIAIYLAGRYIDRRRFRD